tara:strand:+ start:67 stop:309 length:243 start_codon:yes stop_codon:yes gene_type:complete
VVVLVNQTIKRQRLVQEDLEVEEEELLLQLLQKEQEILRQLVPLKEIQVVHLQPAVLHTVVVVEEEQQQQLHQLQEHNLV